MCTEWVEREGTWTIMLVLLIMIIMEIFIMIMMMIIITIFVWWYKWCIVQCVGVYCERAYTGLLKAPLPRFRF